MSMQFYSDEFPTILLHAQLIEPGGSDDTLHLVDDCGDEYSLTFDDLIYPHFTDPARQAGKFTAVKTLRTRDVLEYEAYDEKGLSFTIQFNTSGHKAIYVDPLNTHIVKVTKDTLRDLFEGNDVRKKDDTFYVYTQTEERQETRTIDLTDSGVTVEARDTDLFELRFSGKLSGKGHLVFSSYETLGEVALTVDYKPFKKPRIAYKVDRMYRW